MVKSGPNLQARKTVSAERGQRKGGSKHEAELRTNVSIAITVITLITAVLTTSRSVAVIFVASVILPLTACVVETFMFANTDERQA